MIKLRFVKEYGLISKGISFAEDFPYSHVEAVTPSGTYLGAHAKGGVQDRKSDYDKGQFSRELFVELESTPAQALQFYNYLEKKIGTPYDYQAIVGFVSRLDLHTTGRVICSAIQTLALRDCLYFKWPLAVRAHETSPRDLGLVLSGRQSLVFGE